MFKYIFSAILVVIASIVFVFDFELTNHTIGNLFVAGILGCLVVFLLFKFGLHYKIKALNNFANAFYYSVLEYKKAQVTPSGITYRDSVREQAEVALAANFDPTLATADLKIPATLYSGKDPLLAELRARIQKAEKIKLEARNLDRKANVILGKTKEELVENELAEKESGRVLDRVFEIEPGVAAIIDLTAAEIGEQGYDRAPDYDIITRIAFDDNVYFSHTYKYFESDDVEGVLFRAPFMIILMGIIGTFAGFYLALNQGGDIKSGASVAIISSLVGLPISLLMDYINTLFPDKEQYQQAFNKFKVCLEMLFIHEQELNREETEVVTTKLLEEKELALERAEQERIDALAKQEAELEKQKQEALAQTEQQLIAQAAQEAAELKKESTLALEQAEKKSREALAKQEAELRRQKQLEVVRAEREFKEQAEREAEKWKKEKELALKEAEKKVAKPWPSKKPRWKKKDKKKWPKQRRSLKLSLIHI